MRFLISILLVFNLSICYCKSITSDSLKSYKTKIDFEKEDAYFIINDYEFTVKDDTIDTLSIKSPRYSSSLLNVFYNPIDTYSVVSPFSHCVSKRYLKLKLNTKAGVEKWAYYILNSDDFSKIQYLNIKIVKPDGNVLDVDNNNFLNKAEMFKKSNQDTFIYSIEGMKVGDIVEVAYFSDYIPSNYITIETKIPILPNLPSLVTNRRYIFPLSYNLFYKCFNGLESPVISKDSIEKIQAIEFSYNGKQYNIDSLAPSYYLLLKRGVIKKHRYIDVYNKFFSFSNPELNQFEGDIRWIKENLEQYSIRDKYLKFFFIYNLLYRNYENSNYIFGFARNGHINKDQLLKFYVHLFNYLKIDFYLGLADSNYSGDVELETVNEKNLHFMLIFFDNDSNRYIVFPHNDYKYYVNEFPADLNGNTAVLLKQKNKSDIKNNIMNKEHLKDSTELEIRHISLNGGNNNTYTVQSTIKIDSNYMMSHYISNIECYGFYSRLRHSITEFLKGKIPGNQLRDATEYCKIGSIYNPIEESTYPFKFSYNTKGTIVKMIENENDSVLKIELNKILYNYTMDIKRVRNINFAYTFLETRNYTIEFPTEINLLNIDSLYSQIDNTYGTFKFEFLTTAKNKIHLVTTFAIKQEHIPKESFKYLQEIIKASNLVLNSKLVISIKK